MFYSLNHEGIVEQGDICYNLPKFIPSELISEEGNESPWDNYLKSLKNKEIPSVTFSVLPSPAWGVTLSQTCDIENAKEGEYILFAELINYDNYENIEFISSNNKKRSYLENIIDTIRNEPAKHYFPELIINDDEKYGPWILNFQTIFLVPTDLIKNNKDLFWKARLINTAKEVLKEKISRFFTRLAFEECIFFSSLENKYYIDLMRKNLKDKIIEARKKCGIID